MRHIRKKPAVTAGMLSLLAALLCLYLYLQYGRDMDVYNTISTTSSNYHEERITVIANRLFIADREQCADYILQKCRENSFQNTRFSYDRSKPNAVYAKVYLSEHAIKYGNPVFEFSYTHSAGEYDAYNIIEDVSHFNLEIRDSQ